MYHGRERFRVGVLVSPTMERQNESYLARAVWQRIWANLGSGSLSQNLGAWMAYAIK